MREFDSTPTKGLKAVGLKKELAPLRSGEREMMNLFMIPSVSSKRYQRRLAPIKRVRLKAKGLHLATHDELHLPALKSGAADYVVSAAKAALGAVPFAGSLLAEVAGTIIPNQRVDRIVKYAEQFDKRLADLDHDFVKAQLTNENFTDLMEESIRQAARALSDERRQYIASVVANGLSSEDIEFFESKHLFRVLGEINDVEVLILRFYLVGGISGDKEFREKHKDIVTPEPVVLTDGQKKLDKNALNNSYKNHLLSLGLLEIDDFLTTSMDRQYRITPLGKLLLKHSGLEAS